MDTGPKSLNQKLDPDPGNNILEVKVTSILHKKSIWLLSLLTIWLLLLLTQSINFKLIGSKNKS